MTYLENNICDFEILFPEKKLIESENIISSCFFRMPKHYKSLSKYIDGIKNVIKIVNNQNKYTFRLFIDEHIRNDKKIFNILNSSPKVEIVVFKCSEYIKEEYHIDLFGTLVRLFPCFNFPNNNAKNVIVIDIDLHDILMRRLIALLKYDSKEPEIIAFGDIDDLVLKNDRNPHLYCGLTAYFNFKFDNEILINFIKTAHKIKDTGVYGKRNTPFGLGVDELFLTKYLIYGDNYKHIKNIKIGLIFEYTFNWFMYYYKDKLLEQNKTVIYNNLKYILGKYWKPSYNLNKLFEIIDNYMYSSINEHHGEKIYLSNRYFQLLDILKKKKTTLYNDEFVNSIIKKFDKIIYSISVIYFRPDDIDRNFPIKHITDFKLYSKQTRNIKHTKNIKYTKKNN